MTLYWAVSATVFFGAALLFVRSARRAPAAVRHLALALAFCCTLALPLIPQVEPVRRLQTAVVLVVGPDDAVAVSGAAPSVGLPAGNLLAAIWVVGAALTLMRLVKGLLPRRSARPAPESVVTLGDGLARGLGIRRRVRFEISAPVPETRGLLRPVVALPADAGSWPDDRLTVVLVHELIHVARHDWALTAVGELASALHWFNPLAWMALGALRREREIACDDAVLRHGAERCEYASHLLAVASGLRAAPAVVAMAHTCHLETRIRAILNPDAPKGGVTMKTGFTAAFVATALLVALTAMRAPAQSGTAGLSGTVLDASSARVPQASVIVRNVETGKAEIVRTDETGEFTFASLPAGTYNVEIARRGFQLYKQENVVLAGGSAQKLSVVLALGRLTEVIDVKGTRVGGAVPADTSKPPERVRVGGDVQAAKMVRMVRPAYPAQAKAAGIEGSVLMEAVVGRDGTILNLKTLNSLVHADLVEAAMTAVRQWQYEPTYLNGQPVEVITAITVNFTLAK